MDEAAGGVATGCTSRDRGGVIIVAMFWSGA